MPFSKTILLLQGDLWSQNWEPLADLLLPKTIDLDQRMKHLNWTVIDMVNMK